MTTFFTPKTYSTIDDMMADSYFNAVSDTAINGVDIFGYVDNVPYIAEYQDDKDGDVEFYTVATDYPALEPKALKELEKMAGFFRQ